MGQAKWWVVLLFASIVALPRAHADVITQPNGVRVPALPGCRDNRPTGLLPTFACICDVEGVCNIGEPCASETSCDDGMNANCESRMWHVFNDNTCIPTQSDGIDPREDASLLPETYSPTCALTFTVESRGTATFRNAFGWYNVVEGQRPRADDLHVMLDCDAPVGTTVVLDVRSEPAYRGGEIGFFLLTPESHTTGATCAGGDCCASVDRYQRGDGWAYFSERRYNPDHRGSESFIHLLVYDSIVSERKFYFAWEDTYDAALDDFTDLVTSVTGVECGGAGRDCDTGRAGACGRGITRCENGVLVCNARYTGESEACDGLDNDCDENVDESAPCPERHVCDNGECVPHCVLSAEFMCLGPREECDDGSGFCVEPACRGVDCPSGEICREGMCRRECEGIVCPAGSTCFLDRCIDACAEHECAAGQVCRGGFCLPGCNQCDGLVCDEGQVCDETSGDCRHPDCPTSCPAGQFCDGPDGCRDACEGAVCPRLQTCVMGRCAGIEPEPPSGGTDSGTRTSDAGSVDAGFTLIPRRPMSDCGCRTSGHRSTSAFAFVFVAIALFRLRRRRAS